MALQNQTFASAIPSATVTSAFSYPTSNMTTLSVVSNEDASYENYYGSYYESPFNHAPPSLPYTVQQAIGFGKYIRDYSYRAGKITFTLRLAADGCRQSHSSTEDVTYDCSVACVNPKDMFTHTPTMANCMAYGLIADALVSGNASDDFNQIASKYGISANRTTAALVGSTILLCTNQCKSLKTCGVTSGSDNSNYVSYDSPAYANMSLYYEVSDICVGVIAPVMTDIAGIGVGILIRSHERQTTDDSTRYISHTGSKVVLRSRLLVYSSCTISGFTTLSFLLSSGAEATQEPAAPRVLSVEKPRSVLFHASLLHWWNFRRPSATSC